MSSRVRSEFGTLGDRVAQSSGEASSGAVAAYAVTPRHVWVDGEHAGVLLGWQRPAGEWLCQVVWAPPEHPVAVAVDWLPVSRVRPA